MPHDVFVSYSSDDKSAADAVCAALETSGIRCWIAPRDILPGTDWSGAIIDAINTSSLLVLVYSAKANESSQIKREVERAVNRGVAIIPFRLEDVPMSSSLEYFVSMPQWLDAFPPPLENHLDRLAETVRVSLERRGAVVAKPSDEAASGRPKKARPLTNSRDVAQRIGYWVAGAEESPTLAAMVVPRSDKVATIVLIAASVVAISLLAQVWIGPIWLQPLAVLAVGAVLGSRAGALATIVYIALGILGLPVFGPGIGAWTTVEFRAPYVRYGLGYLAGLVAAAYAAGWLSERRSWDRHPASAARLALAGVVLMYVPGFIWLEVAALLMREREAPSGVLPSIAMLAITIAVLAFALPRAWAAATAMQHAASQSSSAPATAQATPTDTPHTPPRL
jgi:biotin transporter BioY